MATNDILVGPGRIYRAPLGTAAPDESTVDFGEAWGGVWTDVGDFLEGEGVTLTLEEEFFKLYTEQQTAPVIATRTKREAIVKCTLAEHSAANLALVLSGTTTTTAAGAAQKGYSEISIGSDSEIDMYKWGIEGARKDALDQSQPVRYFFHRGYIGLSGDINYAKTEGTGIPIEITVMADPDQAAGQELGTLQIITSPVTT